MPSPLRVRFRKTASGPGFGPFQPGEEAELPYARARDLIDSGQADNLGSVEPEPEPEPEPEKPVRIERAVRRQPEAAVAPPQREQRDPDRGGLLPPGKVQARNLTGSPEQVASNPDKSDADGSSKK